VRGSILGELLWLIYFLALLVIAVYAINIFVVPYHFNPVVANVIAAFAAILVYVWTRSYARRRGKG
jgi:divalent metal cation (Fe/Co/Zn/Cd) transporter